ncbi:TPA: hypothetical protein IXF72_000099 [Enterococcus faecium]|nr:hypothetical protein [Enterococcus faecium]
MLKRIAWDKDNKTDIELKEYKYNYFSRCIDKKLLFKKEGLEFSFDEDEFEKLVMDWRKNLLDMVQV